MVPDLGSSRGEITTSKIGFYPGNVKERLAKGMQRTTRLMVGYDVVKVCQVPISLEVVRQFKCLTVHYFRAKSNRLQSGQKPFSPFTFCI